MGVGPQMGVGPPMRHRAMPSPKRPVRKTRLTPGDFSQLAQHCEVTRWAERTRSGAMINTLKLLGLRLDTATSADDIEAVDAMLHSEITIHAAMKKLGIAMPDWRYPES